MGNSLRGAGGKKSVKVMKIDGQIFKLKTPIKAIQVTKDYPNHVLLESKSVKRFGIRAIPLQPQQFLDGGKIYFLVELPKLTEPESEGKTVSIRRVQSGVNMTAKERLECLMLSRRSTSDVSSDGSIRVKVRLRKAEVEKLMGESGDEGDVRERIVDLCVKKSGQRLRRTEDGSEL